MLYTSYRLFAFNIISDKTIRSPMVENSHGRNIKVVFVHE